MSFGSRLLAVFLAISATSPALVPVARLGRRAKAEEAVSRAPNPAPKMNEGGRVDFERHVVSLFGRAGCNTGACHGSFQGKGGLRLSLFGYEPERDFRALTHDAGGRRVDTYDPDHSLILLKATGQVSHGGGRRIALDSWQYQVLRTWIADGCRHEPGSGAVSRLEVEPREFEFRAIGEETDLKVRAVFADRLVCRRGQVL